MRGKLHLGSTLLSLSVIFSTLLAATRAHPQYKDPLLTGYVTATHPDGSFEIDGAAVELTPAATFWRKTGAQLAPVAPRPTPWLGQAFDCFGKYDKKRNTLVLRALTQLDPLPTPIQGEAIVEAVLPGPTLTLRADGYLLQLPSTLHFEDGLTAPGADQWITYKGTLHPDGNVTVTEATLSRILPPADEIALRQRQTFNPENVDPDHPQSGLSKAVIGVDAKRLPPHDDPALQARITAIGNSLVPAWLRALDPKDPGRVDFRFVVVDAPRKRTATSFTSGIIVLPFSVIERLDSVPNAAPDSAPDAVPVPDPAPPVVPPNAALDAPPNSAADARIAAVLAAAIAEVLEKQAYRDRGRHHAFTAASLASSALMVSPVGVLALPLGLAGSFGAGAADRSLASREVQQSSRVSLWLLSDAGYDLTQAPVAWWSLSPKTPKPLAQIALPPETIILYAQLGTTWHSLPGHQPAPASTPTSTPDAIPTPPPPANLLPPSPHLTSPWNTSNPPTASSAPAPSASTPSPRSPAAPPTEPTRS